MTARPESIPTAEPQPREPTIVPSSPPNPSSPHLSQKWDAALEEIMRKDTAGISSDIITPTEVGQVVIAQRRHELSLPTLPRLPPANFEITPKVLEFYRPYVEKLTESSTQPPYDWDQDA
jgi:hypothetical protein